jgi:dephospho-CoA kinase
MTAIVGLTGGIASGKSTVGRLFRGFGVHVVDADLVARSVVAEGTDGFEEVVREFGAGVLGPEGSIDRKKLGAIVFGDNAKRKKLEAITHPRIAQKSMAELAALATRGDVYGIYEAALLVETGSHRMMQAVVVVASTLEHQLRRVVTRDGLSEEEARARIAAQLPLEKKIELADYVIWNDGSMAELEARTADVHAALIARFEGTQP